jgi:hypothetical protein
MKDLIYFIILSLAVWRLTKMFVDEAGPYKLIERLRNKIINEPWSPLHCFKCTSIWSAFFLTLLLHPSIEIFILYWLGASTVAIYIRDFMEYE